MNLPLDGYYIIIPNPSSRWVPVAVHIFNSSQKETYIVLESGYCCTSDPSPTYYEEVVTFGGSIKKITKDQFDMLGTIYRLKA